MTQQNKIALDEKNTQMKAKMVPARQAEGQVRPLSTVQSSDKVRLVRVDAGRGLNSRLAAMGFVPDVEITVVSNGHPGPFVIIVMDTKMMLGRGVAHKIMVK